MGPQWLPLVFGDERRIDQRTDSPIEYVLICR